MTEPVKGRTKGRFRELCTGGAQNVNVCKVRSRSTVEVGTRYYSLGRVLVLEVGFHTCSNLYLHLLLMVSRVRKILLTCGAVTSSGFTILLMAQLPQTCCLLLTLASPMMILIGHPSILAEVIEVAIGKLKCGKSDGDTFMSDHIIEAPSSICQLVARLFTSMLRHGFMPLAFQDATIQPIPKGSKDPSLSENYCGIALASSLSKVMKWSIPLTLRSFFTNSDLQFGFKLGFSTTLCTGVLKAVINRYLNNGSTVYVCLIDTSKAFDLVDHHILFDKLLERGTPKPVVRLLLHRYKSQQLCNRWR